MNIPPLTILKSSTGFGESSSKVLMEEMDSPKSDTPLFYVNFVDKTTISTILSTEVLCTVDFVTVVACKRTNS